MAFLTEGEVHDLMKRGPNKDTLIQWASEMKENAPYDQISQYANQFGLTVSEFESIVNIFAAKESNPSNLDILSDLLSDIKIGKEEGYITENYHFEKTGDPYRTMDIGQTREEKYIFGQSPHRDKRRVSYLKNRPIGLNENHQYRAVIYQDPDYENKWILAIEVYHNNKNGEGWNVTPGQWYLESLLGEDNYTSPHSMVKDTIMIDDGQKWGVTNMIPVLKEAKKIRDEYINKTNTMKESILMPRLLKEDHNKECSDEASMAKIQLKSIMDAAGEILQGLDNCEQLDAWVQSKISIAEDYITTVAKYMKYEEEEKPAELPLVPAGSEVPQETDVPGDEMMPDDAMPPDEDMMMSPMNGIKAPLGPDEEPEEDMMQSDLSPEEEDEIDDDFDFADDEGGNMMEEPREDDLQVFAKGELAD